MEGDREGLHYCVSTLQSYHQIGLELHPRNDQSTSKEKSRINSSDKKEKGREVWGDQGWTGEEPWKHNINGNGYAPCYISIPNLYALDLSG